MITTLPMYDYPENSQEVNGLWRVLRDALRGVGVDAPEELERGVSTRQGWASPDLLVTQCCGADLAAGTYGLTYLATPDPGLDGLAPGAYAAVVALRAADAASWRADRAAFVAKARPAFNEPQSFSGAIALRRHLASFGSAPGAGPAPSGAHRASLGMVRDGSADFATIDVIAWRWFEAIAPAELEGLVAIERTTAAPAPPLAIGPRFPKALLAPARRALLALPPGAFGGGWRRIIALDEEAYRSMR